MWPWRFRTEGGAKHQQKDMEPEASVSERCLGTLSSPMCIHWVSPEPCWLFIQERVVHLGSSAQSDCSGLARPVVSLLASHSLFLSLSLYLLLSAPTSRGDFCSLWLRLPSRTQTSREFGNKTMQCHIVILGCDGNCQRLTVLSCDSALLSAENLESWLWRCHSLAIAIP